MQHKIHHDLPNHANISYRNQRGVKMHLLDICIIMPSAKIESPPPHSIFLPPSFFFHERLLPYLAGDISTAAERNYVIKLILSGHCEFLANLAKAIELKHAEIHFAGRTKSSQIKIAIDSDRCITECIPYGRMTIM